ncbi:MAG: ATP-grasp domain-containing protein [Candidatus Sericytochromatia bacterium]|nr:ATP-grasp domain-containing protein [Candidatus Sericytochromatia bacterium]
MTEDLNFRQPSSVFRVLVFPACNEPGLEIIHSLIKSNKVEVVGGSSQDHQYDPARAILRDYHDISSLQSPGFAADFRAFLTRQAIDLVFPTTDALVAEFSSWTSPTTRFVTPGEHCARILLSKSETYRHLEGVVPVPEVYPSAPDGRPAFAKPDIGSGSRGGRILQSVDDYYNARGEGLLVTEYLPGEECTVDCVSDLAGRLLVANPRVRGKVGRGIALGAKSFVSAQIQEWLSAASSKLHLRGPWFAQFKRDREGNYKLLEINARVAGSMGLTRYSGVNIPLMCVFMFLGYNVQVPQLQSGVLVNRSLASWVEMHPYDAVIWDLDDTLLRKDGKPDPIAVAHLIDGHNRGIRQFLLSKNRDVDGVLRRFCIPRLFSDVRQSENKFETLRQMIADHHLELSKLVLVNDSYSELFQFQAAFPEIRIVTPADIDCLGWETLA